MDSHLTDNPNINTSPTASEETTELSHTDKIAGVFTEPAKTYETTAKFPLRTIDWLLPFILVLVLTVISQFILFSNPELSYQMEQKQRQAVHKLIDEGKMTQEQADRQAQFTKGPAMAIIRSASTLIFGFIFILLVTGIYFFLAKFVLKGDGTFVSALVANGLSVYIAMLQIILATIFSIVMQRWMQDVSASSLLNMDKSTIGGWLLSFVDIITIWAFSVFAIGLAKLFKSKTTLKYFVLVFGLWILWKVIVFALSNAIPFLKNF